MKKQGGIGGIVFGFLALFYFLGNLPFALS